MQKILEKTLKDAIKENQCILGTKASTSSDKEIKETFLWYKRRLAIAEDINIEDILDENIKDVEILTEKINE